MKMQRRTKLRVADCVSAFFFAVAGGWSLGLQTDLSIIKIMMAALMFILAGLRLGEALNR